MLLNHLIDLCLITESQQISLLPVLSDETFHKRVYISECSKYVKGVESPVELRIKYDRLADAPYTRLRDGKIVESDEVAPGVIVDLDENNEVVGIEVLQVSKCKLDLLKLLLEGPESLVARA